MFPRILSRHLSKFIRYFLFGDIVNMEQNKQYFRCLMLFYFRKGKNATQTKKRCAVYGEDAVSERVCQYWFAQFRAGDTTCEDDKRLGRPLVADDNQIKI